MATTSNKATSMAELLASHKSTFVALRKGEVVKATVSKVTPSEILLEVGAKTEAVVLEKDRKIMKHLVSLLNVGDSVEAMILSPESDMGYPVVSLRHFATDKTWKLLEELLKSQEKVDVEVKEATKGGFLVESSTGVAGFLPNSHIAPTTELDEIVGKHLEAAIVDLNRAQNKVIFSEKGVITDEAFKAQTAQLKIGEKVKGTVSGITSFGIFVSLTNPQPNGEGNQEKSITMLDGLIHISEVSWERTADLATNFTQGQEVEAVVIGFDKDAKRIDLSLKRLTSDPFQSVVSVYPVDKKVTGEVTAVTDQGVEVSLSEVDGIKIEGIIRKDKIPPTTTYAVGQEIQATVVQIDTKKRKVILTPVLKEKPLMYR